MWKFHAFLVVSGPVRDSETIRGLNYFFLCILLPSNIIYMVELNSRAGTGT